MLFGYEIENSMTLGSLELIGDEILMIRTEYGWFENIKSSMLSDEDELSLVGSRIN